MASSFASVIIHPCHLATKPPDAFISALERCRGCHGCVDEVAILHACVLTTFRLDSVETALMRSSMLHGKSEGLDCLDPFGSTTIYTPRGSTAACLVLDELIHAGDAWNITGSVETLALLVKPVKPCEANYETATS